VKIIYIETTDEAHMDALDSVNIPGIEVRTRLTAAVIFDQVIEYVVKVADSELARTLFYSFLYDILKKVVQSRSQKTKAHIDGHTIEDIHGLLIEVQKLQKEITIQKYKDSNDDPDHM
jgi:hypothetical protein